MANEMENVTTLVDLEDKRAPTRAIEISLEEARNYFDNPGKSFVDSEAFENALDNIQGEVQQGAQCAFLVIKIVM